MSVINELFSDEFMATDPNAAPVAVQELSREQRERLEDVLARRIDQYITRQYSEPHRSHLGASLIGHECMRHLWYNFRWALPSLPTPRMLRLFNRGHREEPRFMEWLRGAGLEVYDVNPEDGKQFRCQAVRGHFGGSLDGQAKGFSEEFIKELGFIPPPMLCEFKTNGTGAGFDKVTKNKCAVAKPQHFVQASTYGRFYGYRYAIYLLINKNDDSLHVEIVELDWTLADEGVRKAEEVINSPTPPHKISQSPSYQTCFMCDFKSVCHGPAPYEKNCRSCRFAQPVDNAEWFCHNYAMTIPKDFIPKGCDQYVEAR